MIDWHRVESLREEVGREDFAEIAGLFLEEVESTLDRVKEAYDGTKLEHLLHSLKGSALNLGFSDLARLAATAEASARAGEIHGVATNRIVQCFHASRSAFFEATGLGER